MTAADKTTPERIYIKPCDPCRRDDDYYLCHPRYLDGRETAYVRADLADAQAQEIARLRNLMPSWFEDVSAALGSAQ